MGFSHHPFWWSIYSHLSELLNGTPVWINQWKEKEIYGIWWFHTLLMGCGLPMWNRSPVFVTRSRAKARSSCCILIFLSVHLFFTARYAQLHSVFFWEFWWQDVSICSWRAHFGLYLSKPKAAAGKLDFVARLCHPCSCLFRTVALRDPSETILTLLFSKWENMARCGQIVSQSEREWKSRYKVVTNNHCQYTETARERNENTNRQHTISMDQQKHAENQKTQNILADKSHPKCNLLKELQSGLMILTEVARNLVLNALAEYIKLCTSKPTKSASLVDAGTV